MDELDKAKAELVLGVQMLSALFAKYTEVSKLDAYECHLDFVFADGEGRIRLTDSKYKKNPKDGKLQKFDGSDDPNASSLDGAEANRQAGKLDDMPLPSTDIRKPEQVVADLMKQLKLK